jgi:two-component system, LuxR family, sensor kinase FixL
MAEPISPNNESPSVEYYTTLYTEIKALKASLERETAARMIAEESLRETHAAMLKHQQIGKMGDFRFNTVTGESRGSSVSLEMSGHDPSAVSVVPFEAWANSVHPDDRSRILAQLFECIRTRAPMRFEYRMIVRGEARHIRCDGEPDEDHQGDLVYYGVLTDITERKDAEQALRKVEAELAASLRLASMGELAGSIVHEINQPLAAISTSAEACRRWLAAGPEHLDRAAASLARVIEESQGAAEVVSGLRSLIRNAELDIVPLHLEAVIEEVGTLVIAELGREGILLEIEVTPGLPTVLADRVHLQQVIMNLVRNAIEAMRTTQGRRTLRLAATSDQSSVIVAVSDTGPGIAQELGAKLFEPLYTTKPNGMGLGLSISRKIARALGGEIRVDHTRTVGAKFLLSLPIANPAQPQARVCTEQQVASAGPGADVPLG